MKKRVMLDTSVMKEVIDNSGIGSEVYSCILNICHTLVVTWPVIQEYICTLRNKQHILKPLGLLRRKFDQLREKDIGKFDYANPMSVPNIDITEDDRHLVECAVGGNCDYLISTDWRHVLPLKKFRRTTAIPPLEFLNLVNV